MPTLQWEIFCRVVDNFGDAGVCWRLAADLGARGHRVRLVIDDASPLAFMAPGGAPGVEVHAWPGPAHGGDVVIEAFGCDPPQAVVDAMSARAQPPVWINLEYLSAEPYVERSHGLRSPQRSGLIKWFFYPGFTPRTGGLLREPGLQAARDRFDRETWLGTHALARRPGERVCSLFCYDDAPVPALLDALSDAPTLLLLTPGAAQRRVSTAPPAVRLHRLPWLDQGGFDRLLWSSDLNFVRGEDSLVRAIWAGAPFVWQAYPQHDGAHAAKLSSMAETLALDADVVALWRTWNGLAPLPGGGLAWPEARRWQRRCAEARQRLASMPDLVTQLCAFVHAHGRGTMPG